jgi:hypothetical protein
LQAMDAKLERRKNYCALGVAMAEDLPMGGALPSSNNCAFLCVVARGGV